MSFQPLTKIAGIMILLLGSVFAQSDHHKVDRHYLTVTSVTVKEVSIDVLNQENLKTLYTTQVDPPQGLPDPTGVILDKIDAVGRVISVAQDIVALGQDVYDLVLKGKPSNHTSYVPISVLPRNKGKMVDLFDTENWSIPKKYTFEVTYKNSYQMDVVRFRYSVIYSFNGSYNGKGAYLTAAQIIPDRVNTLWGYDFTATMKLGGIQNVGTKANPIAAATLMMEYTMSNLLRAQNETAIFHIDGKGGFRKYQR